MNIYKNYNEVEEILLEKVLSLIDHDGGTFDLFVIEPDGSFIDVIHFNATELFGDICVFLHGDYCYETDCLSEKDYRLIKAKYIENDKDSALQIIEEYVCSYGFEDMNKNNYTFDEPIY
jgi:hypothetical protein